MTLNITPADLASSKTLCILGPSGQTVVGDASLIPLLFVKPLELILKASKSSLNIYLSCFWRKDKRWTSNLRKHRWNLIILSTGKRFKLLISASERKTSHPVSGEKLLVQTCFFLNCRHSCFLFLCFSQSISTNHGLRRRTTGSWRKMMTKYFWTPL